MITRPGLGFEETFDFKKILELLSCHIHAETEAESQLNLLYKAQTILNVDGIDLILRREDSLYIQASTVCSEHLAHLKIENKDDTIQEVYQTLQVHMIPNQLWEKVGILQCPESTLYSSALFVPLGDPHCIGVLILRKKDPWNPDPYEIEFCKQMSQVLALLIEGFQVAVKVGAKSAAHFGAVSEVATTLLNSPYLEEILQLLVNLTAEQFHFKVCTVRLLDPQNDSLVLRATQSPVKAYQQKPAIKLGESIAGRAIQENRPQIIQDVLLEEDYIGHDLAIEQGLRSMICIPLTIQKEPVGVLSCYTDKVRTFHPSEIRALQTLAKQAAVSIEHAKLRVRNTLMQEMHHRVKNNLQQVVSLLRLQLRLSRYKTLEEAIKDSLSRILAIASVHDLLSREDLDCVNIKNIAESLVQITQQSLLLPEKSIGFLVRGHEVRLNITQATQIALILNELLQNAVEHGFKYSNAGEIHISIEENETDVMLWVSQHGDALPEGFDPSLSKGLGMQIIESLVRGMGGTFKMSDIMGWIVADVRFKRAMNE